MKLSVKDNVLKIKKNLTSRKGNFWLKLADEIPLRKDHRTEWIMNPMFLHLRRSFTRSGSNDITSKMIFYI